MLAGTLKDHDMFISYAVEDRELVEDLYARLTAAGLKVWYANRDFQVGTFIRDSIEEGLQRSCWGLALISPAYTGHWAWGELFILLRGRFIPVLHGISIEELQNINPQITNYYCLHTSDGLDYVVSRILKDVKPMSGLQRHIARTCRVATRHYIKLAAASAALILALTSFYFYTSMIPSHTVIENAILQRTDEIQVMAKSEMQQSLMQTSGDLVKMPEIDQKQKSFYSINKIQGFVNKVVYQTGVESISTVPELLDKRIFALGSNVEPPFGLKDFTCYLAGNTSSELDYILLNMYPIHYKVLGTETVQGGFCEVQVKYTNFLRYARVKLLYERSGRQGQRQISMLGLKPIETLVFEKRDEQWKLLTVR